MTTSRSASVRAGGSWGGLRGAVLALCAMLAAWSASAPVVAQPSLRALDFNRARKEMVDNEIVGAGVTNPRVIEAMRNTQRHEFVLPAFLAQAYLDMALPIGNRQTISPPFVVAYMTEQLDPQPEDRVLEIGTGSGYQAAILSPLVKDVYTIEIVPMLGQRAAATLREQGYKNVHTRIGDGYLGWPEAAPFDKIIVTCSPENVPQPLVDQLKEGGRMIVPLGERYQQTLYLFTKRDGKLVSEALLPTLFVPMTGEAEEQREVQPDPANPQVANGSFEELVGETEEPLGWHYQRQLTLRRDDPPAGEHYVRFKNDEPGLGSQALQGFAIDGRQVSEIEISLWVRGQSLNYGQNRSQRPTLAVTFYDERRDTAGRVFVGPWIGTFGWRHVTLKHRVPQRAREAIVHVGLFGGVGELSVDDIQLRAVKSE